MLSERPVLIAGPTASGKSELALAVAERDRGVVINADALQVYAGWRVLTARPGPADEARAPHRLYGHVAMAEHYSVGRWLREVAAELAAARAAGLRPVIVGGTGLYLTALVEGLAAIPPVPPEVRRAAEARAPAGLAAELARRDPETHAAIDLANPVRVRRAWEVLTATGTGLRDWQRRTGPPLVGDAVRIVVAPPVPVLDARIAARFDAMLAAGALDEVRRAAAGWDDARPSAKALGALPLLRHLRGEVSLAEARAAAVLATRRFAKRQRTWARGRMKDWDWHEPPADVAGLARLVPRS